ncbi:MAG: AbrB/MazE/SpoVT family DNA-binding domain-containing protein [Candidatus Jordarchaeum sp.]|uniref:AbrB/MazE/SpoVT family DNA-binding domain-containing protein n=1 Tax=Candidatus Jordarchaeum sp. TaxID=2823881 RepID=UPI00404A9F03
MAKIGKDKFIFGTVKVGERGQIVIPKEAREKFNINPGDTLIVMGDLNKGIAIAKVEGLKGFAVKILGASEDKPLEPFEIPEVKEEKDDEKT